MKYRLSLDGVNVEAVFNKLGGAEGARRFLSGELAVVEVAKKVAEEASKLLAFVASFTVAATEKFVARDFFTENKFYLGNNFKPWFLGKVEEPLPETSLCCHTLQKWSRDLQIIAELGGEEKVETTLSQIAALLEGQANREVGILLTDGRVNIFYVRDQNGVLRVVSARWRGDGWDLHVGALGYPVGWRDGRRVFSRNSVG